MSKKWIRRRRGDPEGKKRMRKPRLDPLSLADEVVEVEIGRRAGLSVREP
jgi:hypothetical protein